MKVYFLAFIVFFLSSLSTFHVISSDESVYVAMARNVFTASWCGVERASLAPSFNYQMLPNFVYPMLISSFMCVGDFSRFFLVVKLLNSFLFLIQLFFIAKTAGLLLDEKHKLWVTITSALFVYTNFSALVMVEPLSYALSAWIIYLVIKWLKEKKSFELIVLATLMSMAYLVKINFVVFPVSMTIVLLGKLIDERRDRFWENLSKLCVFVLSFIVCFSMIFLLNSRLRGIRVFGYYNTNIVSYLQVNISSAIRLFLFSGYYLISNILFLPIFLILPLFRFLFRKDKGKDILFGEYLLFILALLGSLLVVFSVHSVTNEYQKYGFYIHEREYLYLLPYLLIGVFYVFINFRISSKQVWRYYLFLSIVSSRMSKMLEYVKRGGEIIPMPSLAIVRFFPFGLWKYTLGVLVLGVIVSMCLKRKKQFGGVILLIMFVCLVKYFHMRRLVVKQRDDVMYRIDKECLIKSSKNDLIVNKTMRIDQQYRLLMTNSFTKQVSTGENIDIGTLQSFDNLIFVGERGLKVNSLGLNVYCIGDDSETVTVKDGFRYNRLE